MDGFRRRLLIAKLKPEIDEYFKGGDMEGTPWYKSKTKWASIMAGILAAVGPASTAMGHPVEVPEWVYPVLGGLGFWGLRDAVGKNTLPK